MLRRVWTNNKWVAVTAIVTALAVLSWGLSGCGRKETQKKPEAATAESTPVQVQSSMRGTVTHWVPVSGSLVALSDVPLSSRINGRLSRVLVREGDSVSAGQVVAELDMADQRSQLRMAQSAVQVASSRLDQAKASHRQQLVTSQSGIKVADAAYSQQRVNTRTGIDSAQAALESAQAQLSQVREGSRAQDIRRAQEQVTIAQAQLEKAESDTARYRTLTTQGAAARATLEQYETAERVCRAQLRGAQEALSLVKEGARTQEVVQAEQAVRQAEERLRQAKAAEALDKVRAADLESARAGMAQIDVRAADVQAARAALRQAYDSAAIARKALADAFIRSPISGQVASRTAEPGQVVSSGTAILRVVALGSVGFEPAVPARELGLIRVGQPVEVSVNKLSPTPFAGRVAVIYPAGSQANRTFTIRISIDNKNRLLRPEMFAQGRILVERHENALLVPSEALMRENGIEGQEDVARVFTVENGKAVEYQVRTGLETEDKKWIEVRGLPETAQVITQGQRDLTNGEAVTVGTGTSS
ncbi:MAG: efflux RND transporter periplasmic adaptor subunit [Armatimonadia bacterium]